MRTIRRTTHGVVVGVLALGLGLVGSPAEGQVPRLLADINTQTANGSSAITDVVALGDGVLFAADDGVHGRELWAADATGNVRMVIDLMPGFRTSHPRDLRVVGDHVIYVARRPEYGDEPWITDGTAAGTRLLVDLVPGPEGSVPEELAVVGNHLFFSVSYGEPFTLELWVTDGTLEGTQMVFDQGASILTPYGDSLVFSNGDVWQVDPLDLVPRKISDLRVNPQSSNPSAPPPGWIFGTHDKLFLAADGGDLSYELDLWAGTGSFEDPAFLAIFGSSMSAPTAFGDGIAFAASEIGAGLGTELRFSDGTVAGTRVVDIVPGVSGSAPRDLRAVGQQLFFSAWTPVQGRELWRSNGTVDGTRLIRDLTPGTSSSAIRMIDEVDNELVFLRRPDNAPRSPIWISDGSAEGTRPVTGTFWQSIRDRARQGTNLYMAAEGPRFGAELWLLDTTCFFGGEPLWLQEGRFRVDTCWRRNDGVRGVGLPAPVTEETGGFSFFNPDNVDLAVKILDGREANGQWWFFFGSLTDVEGRLRVTDTETGDYRDFTLTQGSSVSFAATDGFAIDQPISAPLPPASPGPFTVVPLGGGCFDGTPDLCVQDDRFRVSVRWRTPNRSGVGTAKRTADNSGYFWFFRPDNLELLVKVHDGRSANGHFWVYAGALTNVEYTVTVTDTVTGASKDYASPQGAYTSVVDVRAFAD